MTTPPPSTTALGARLGCSTVCFRHLTLDAALDEISALGFTGIDLVALRGLCEHVPPDADEPALSTASRIIRASGLTPLALNADPQSFDEADPAVILDRIDRLSGFCAEVGAPMLILPGGNNHQPRTDDDTDRIDALVDGLLAAADIGRAHGIRTVVEAPHFLRLIGDINRTETIMDRLGDRVPLVFDTSHIRAGGPQPAQIYPRWASRTAHIQIRDAVTGDIRRALGYGDIDFTAFFVATETAGYTGSYVLELETHNSPFVTKTDEVRDACTRLDTAYAAAVG